MRTRAQAADDTGLDVQYLATAFGFDQAQIQGLLDAPNADVVRIFLRSVLEKAQDHEALKTEKLRVDVELENAIRTSDTKLKAQKSTATGYSQEIEQLRLKLNEAETTRERLANELSDLKTSSTDSVTEVQELKRRIGTLEASNRDAFGLVESKSSEKDRLANELSEQHTKVLGLRRELSQSEEHHQALENSLSSQRFREQGLQQELELLKKTNEWQSNELQTKSQEHTKFRKERNATVASLQRELEDGTANNEALQRSETTLRQRLDELQAKTDEAYSKVAGLQEELARNERDSRSQLDSTKRLAELHAQNAATHKARLQELQSQVEQTREDAAEEIGRLHTEVETERADRQEIERKVAELELQLEHLEQQPKLPVQDTPTRNGRLDPTTPARAASPALLGSAQKIARNLTHTQLYSQYTDVKHELDQERRRTNKLQTALDELIQEMESRAPEVVEMKQEQERLEAEVLGFSRMLDESNENRDAAVREALKWQSEADAAAREGSILRQQLRDISAQVKMLLVELQSRDHGLGDMSAQERIELERAARGELDDQALEDTNSTQRFISERLVIFRDIADLQARNEQLLRLTRELGEKMEGEEAREKARQYAADAAEVESLRQQVERYKDELQATATQIDSYMKERDMFRRMLKHRGTLPPDADIQTMFGQSVMPATPQRNGGPPATPRSGDIDDLNKLLKEQQAFFDQFRNESATDRRMLKDQADSLARDKNGLQADIARAQSQLTLASERYELLQSNFGALRNENVELQKRSQGLAENAARQDLRTQQVAEDLVEARSVAESLRNENANSKAEKELWKRIESRLTEDNRGLMEERSRLNKLVADLQNLANERELREGENRHRLQARVDGLESEIAETKRKLEAEVEISRKAALRREYDETQNRTRIDDLVKSLGNVREELVAAKTTRDQLQARVDETRIELRAAEEKAAALRPRPSARTEFNEGRQNAEDDELPTEQRLAIELSELRRDLELARADLDGAREQVEHYKSIAQSTEEELANFNETSEQYREETDKVVTEKDARSTELQERIDELNAELATTNAELSDLRTRHDDSSRVLHEQKASFEAELVRLKDDADRHTEEKRLYQEDLKAQANIAQQSQQSYENELVKHAEAARNLQTVRKEHNDLRTEVAGIRAEADAAKVSLEQGEESWHEQKDRLENEIEELKHRRADVDSQNKLLHQQMESFSSELQAMRQGRTLPTEAPQDQEETPSSGSGEANLQQLINFLRREKEIVDVQYELSVQEAKRLQQQLEYANSQLDDIRQRLADERRQSSDRIASEVSTSKLAQTLNELNLFRESSVTLRNEARQAREKLESKEDEIDKLTAQVEPLKTKLAELEADVEVKDGEIKLIAGDRDHWRERTQNIISKYDRVDPAELEEMKKRIEELQAEKETLEAQQAPLHAQIAEFDERIVAAQEEAKQGLNERLEKFKEQAKEQNRKQNSRLNDSKAAVETAQAEQGRLTLELETLRDELQATAKERDEAVKQIDSDASNKEDVISGEDHAELHQKIAEAEDRASEHVKRADDLQARIGELEAQVASLSSQLEVATAAAGTNDEESGEILEPASDAEILQEVRQTLANAEKEIERLQTVASNVTVENQTTSADTASVSQPGVAAEVEKLKAEMEQQHQLAIQQVEEKAEQKISTLKSNLQRQLREEREKVREEVRAELLVEHSSEVQRVREECEGVVQRLKEEHAVEVAKLAKTEEGASEVQEDDDEAMTAAMKLSDEQARSLFKVHPRLRQIFTNNLRKQVEKETENLTQNIAEKDAEIARLKDAAGLAATDEKKTDLNDKLSEVEKERKTLKEKLDNAQNDKEAAVRQAIDNAEKKTKVQLSQRDMAQAKIMVIQRAAQETPERHVSEVWEEAKKAKPAPKAVAAPAPASPAQAQQPTANTTGGTSQAELAKLQARQERFGTTADSTTRATEKSFGQPSAPLTGLSSKPPQLPDLSNPALQPSPFTTTSPGPNAPNPQAANFVPTAGVQQNQGTGPVALRGISSHIPQPGGSRLPRGGIGNGRGGTGIQSGLPHGAAAAQQGRGGAHSGLPRGGGQSIRGARGRGGGAPNTAAGAGVKRPHEGGEGGDGKRPRGGGPSA